jgi:hypothetical protein
MTATYQREHVPVAWPEISELTRLNHAETNLFGDELRIDPERYAQMEEDGIYRVFTIRKAGELVGYCGFVIYNPLHHIHAKHACQDVLFIKKGHRGHAVRFVSYCDGELRKLGVQIVLQHSPKSKDWSPVLKRLDYQELETTYFRRL